MEQEEISFVMPQFIIDLMEDIEQEFPELNKLERYKLALEIERNWILKEALNIDFDKRDQSYLSKLHELLKF